MNAGRKYLRKYPRGYEFVKITQEFSMEVEPVLSASVETLAKLKPTLYGTFVFSAGVKSRDKKQVSSVEFEFEPRLLVELRVKEFPYAEANKILASGPKVIVPGALKNTHTASVDYRFMLVRTKDLGVITELNSAHSRSLNLMLNQAGTCTFWLNLLDEKAEYVHKHSTSVICYRNGVPIFGGPVYTTKEKSNATTDILEVTCMGWLQYFQKRILHTGAEFSNTEPEKYGVGMVQKAIAEKRITGYNQIGQEQALQLAYNEFPYESGIPQGVPTAHICADLIERANIDVPTLVTVGEIPETTNSIITTLNQFQNIGEQITKLSNIESSFDFYIDPVTRQFHMVRNMLRDNIAGLGVDRGTGVKFTYPGNCEGVEKLGEGLKTINRVEAIGEYGVGKNESLESIAENVGLFEEEVAIADQPHIQILQIYAAVQVATLEQPFTIVTFEPKAVGPEDTEISSVPRPFEDYNIGDFVYTSIERGPRLRIGVGTEPPKPIRIYGMQVSFDDNGIEKVTLQTTYLN